MINYSFLFWLSFYLSNAFNWEESTADEISIWYDIGGIIGGIIGGLVSDLIKKRSIDIFFLMTMGIPSLFVFSRMNHKTKLFHNIMTLKNVCVFKKNPLIARH